MNRKSVVTALAIAGVFGIIGGGLALVVARNNGAKTPMGWCVEEIKRHDMFEENHVSKYAYAGEEATNGLSREWDNVYFVEMVYSDDNGDWYEKWLCGIAYQKMIWSLLREEQITDIGCDRLMREEL